MVPTCKTIIFNLEIRSTYDGRLEAQIRTFQLHIPLLCQRDSRHFHMQWSLDVQPPFGNRDI